MILPEAGLAHGAGAVLTNWKSGLTVEGYSLVSPSLGSGMGEIRDNVTNYIQCSLHDSENKNNLIIIKPKFLP